MSAWDDQQYLKLPDERTRPAQELLARVPLIEAARVVDLGCGPGNSTALLVARFPDAHVTGVDNSSEMLGARGRDLPGAQWIEADIGLYRAQEPVDVLFSNAALHWLPDHEQLLPALLEQLRPGGALAVQMPRNFQEPSHRLMRETEPAPDGGIASWGERLRAVRALTPVLRPNFTTTCWRRTRRVSRSGRPTYQHVMQGAVAIVEWLKGSGLRPYLDALPAIERAHYLQRYTAGIERAYPVRADGRRLFNFPRLFLVATR